MVKGKYEDDEDDVNPFAAPEADEYSVDEDEVGTRYEYATFLTRFAAFFIDSIIQNIIFQLTILILGTFIVSIKNDPNILSIILLQIVLIFLAILYEAGFVSSQSQATPGKMLLGIKITDLSGKRIGFTRALGRYFAKIPSGMILLIGYLMQPYTEKKQALHDIMAGTLVVKKSN